jgi:hypothetical protein
LVSMSLMALPKQLPKEATASAIVGCI